MSSPTDSPVEGAAQDEGIVESGVLDSIRSKLEGQIKPEEIEQLLASDFPKEWAKDPIKATENLIKEPGKYLKETNNPEPKPEGEDKKPKAPAGQPAAEPQAKKVMVSLEIDPESLGTYAKNRKPDEAIIEAIKGIGVKDTLIEDYRKKQIPGLEGQVATEKARAEKAERELADLKKKGSEPPPPPPKKVELPKPPAIPEDNDLLDEKYQKAKAKYDQDMAAALVAQTERADRLEADVAKIRDGVQKVEERVDSDRAIVDMKAGQTTELDSIDRLRKTFNGKGFKYERPFKVIEDDWVSFMRDLHRETGGTSDVFGKDGRPLPEVAEKLNTFFDEKKGDELRKQCEAKKIAPPTDMDDLNKVYAVRQLRTQYGVLGQDGQYHPSTYEQAFELYQARNLNLEEIRLQATKEGQDAFERAKANRKEYAKETDPRGGAAPVDLSKLDQARAETMVVNLIQKGRDRTAEETDTLKYILKECGATPEEIAARLIVPD